MKKNGIFLIGLALSLALISSKKRLNLATKPNIIFILTDDQRFDALGYAGNLYAQTPEMDKLAREGSYFKKAMVTTPICSASRASLLTAMQERSHRYSFETGNVKEEYMKNAYPKMLKKAGYYTGFYGKFGVKYDQKEALFNEYEDYDRSEKYPNRKGYYYKTIGKDTIHLTRYTGQKAIDFIEKASFETPFCLSLSFSAPHAHDNAVDQYFYDEETAHWLDNVTIAPPKLGEDKYFNAQPEAVRKGFSRLRWTWRFDEPEKYQQMVKGYYRMIAGVDREIGRIREALKRKNLDKNTIIILMGDNGYFLGERQLADKWMMYDNSIRVPLMIYDPRNPIHQDLDQMALNIDIPSTILDYAGQPKPANYHGQSLKPIVDGKIKSLERENVLIEHLWEFESIPPSEGIRSNKWKYFRYINDKYWEELYDLKKDPMEINNLAKNPKHLATLKKFRLEINTQILKYTDRFACKPSNLNITEIKNSVKNSLSFSWNVPKEAISQSAYQILVASSKANIEANLADLWNSKQVKSDKFSAIAYLGKPLIPGKKYFYKLRIWDTVNRTGDYSNTETFVLKN
jgi:alpha-L-rhamnosidase